MTLDSIESVAKLLIILSVLIFILWHWSYFSEWAKTISHAEIFGIKLDREDTERHINAFKSRDQAFNADWLNSALKEAELLAPAIQDGRVVWVDSHPENNRDERELLQELGVQIQTLWSTQQLISFIKLGGRIDLIISNIPREGDENPIIPLQKCPASYTSFPDDQLAIRFNQDLGKFNLEIKQRPPAGLSMAEILAKNFPDKFAINQRPRIIYYSASNGGKIFGPCSIIATNRADVLMEKIVDALATSRWSELKGYSIVESKTLCAPSERTSCAK